MAKRQSRSRPFGRPTEQQIHDAKTAIRARLVSDMLKAKGRRRAAIQAAIVRLKKWKYAPQQTAQDEGPCDAVCAEAEAALTILILAEIEVQAANSVAESAYVVWLDKDHECTECLSNP